MAVSHYFLGETAQAHSWAEKASQVESDQPQSREAMLVMGLFAEYRRNQISEAIRDKAKWPRTWLADLQEAYTILAEHPFGHPSQVAVHYDFLMWLGAWRKASEALQRGLKRFPASAELHARYRNRVLRRYGVKKLEESYTTMCAAPDAHPDLPWFAGYASLVAAEFHRRGRRFEEALAAYDRGMAWYEKVIAKKPRQRSSSDHYIAMAHGGKARIYFEMKKDELAVEEILASLKRSEASAATLDGLNISTVEDPVESSIQGVNQFQTNEKAGFTFASALRALLRQDPDIVMVGEIRDPETAKIAVQAALTGHVVLSTLHTNDAPSAVTRLFNIGVEPYLVAAAISGVLAQRLLRKICSRCKEPTSIDDHTLRTIKLIAGEGYQIDTLYQGAGCKACRNTGYSGRVGIFELFLPDDAAMEAIAKGAGLQELKGIAQKSGYRTLADDGLEKVKAGITTVEELFHAAAMH